jgi:hypothetical protein
MSLPAPSVAVPMVRLSPPSGAGWTPTMSARTRRIGGQRIRAAAAEQKK